MVDLSKLSKKEILELEKQIQQYKKTEKFCVGYKVTFCVKFNPELHPIDKHSSLGDTESFGDWLVNVIPNRIIESFNLKRPEDVSGMEVKEMAEEDKEYWGDWWGA